MNRLKGLAILTSGLLLGVLGLGMWRSPEMDWLSFLAEWSILADEIVRLMNDPFAVLGILVVLVGLWMVFNGLRRIAVG